MKQKVLFIRVILIFFLFIILITIPLMAYSQESQGRETSSSSSGVPKNVLIELFINAECTSCPKAAFCLEELAWNYEPGKVILVEEHIWGDGYDIPETNSRYNWYIGDGVKGTPDAFFNGLSERIQGLCCDCGDIDENVSAYQEIIDEQLEKNSPVQIDAGYSICGGKIIVQGDITNASHSMLHNQILSGMVYYEGDESELFYLVKDIFENQDVCQLAPMEEKKFSFVSELNLSNLDEGELDKYYCVVFVQDRLTKEVLQSYLIQ
ncbi:MAG: hypothetical protein PHQ99_05435 [Atribacterota bacterium]|nr:hypothetical protein [Atribacterota bacterium]MDD4289011.1 hypothetical protein [Atribacterota bacterium]